MNRHKHQMAQGKPTGMTLVGRIKLRAIAGVIALSLAAWGAVAIAPAWLALPIVGVAVAAATFTVNKVTSRLTESTCWTCGDDLSAQPAGEHGQICTNCGALNQHARPAPSDDEDARVI